MSEPPPEESPYAAITVNERLCEAGLLDPFYDAFARLDRAAMIAILEQVDMGAFAAGSVDTMLSNPAKYRWGG